MSSDSIVSDDRTHFDVGWSVAAQSSSDATTGTASGRAQRSHSDRSAAAHIDNTTASAINPHAVHITHSPLTQLHAHDQKQRDHTPASQRVSMSAPASGPTGCGSSAPSAVTVSDDPRMGTIVEHMTLEQFTAAQAAMASYAGDEDDADAQQRQQQQPPQRRPAVVVTGFPHDEGCRRNGGRVGAAGGPAVVRAFSQSHQLQQQQQSQQLGQPSLTRQPRSAGAVTQPARARMLVKLLAESTTFSCMQGLWLTLISAVVLPITVRCCPLLPLLAVRQCKKWAQSSILRRRSICAPSTCSM